MRAGYAPGRYCAEPVQRQRGAFLVLSRGVAARFTARRILWRAAAARLGVGELFLARVENNFIGQRVDARALGFDATVDFQPEALTLFDLRKHRAPDSNVNIAGKWQLSGSDLSFPYPEMVEAMLARASADCPRFRGISPVGTTHQARRRRKPTARASSLNDGYEAWSTDADTGSRAATHRRSDLYQRLERMWRRLPSRIRRRVGAARIWKPSELRSRRTSPADGHGRLVVYPSLMNHGRTNTSGRRRLQQIGTCLSALLCIFLHAACDHHETASPAGGDRPSSSAKPTVLPQEDLARDFASATNLVAEARTDDIWRRFTVLQQATVSVADNKLTVNATGDDSALLLPPFAAGKRFIIEVTYESPADTLAQLFYKGIGQKDFMEANSQATSVKAGRNVVYFRVDAPNVIDPLRFDPGAVPGVYVIESMIARAIPAQ